MWPYGFVGLVPRLRPSTATHDELAGVADTRAAVHNSRQSMQVTALTRPAEGATSLHLASHPPGNHTPIESKVNPSAPEDRAFRPTPSPRPVHDRTPRGRGEGGRSLQVLRLTRPQCTPTRQPHPAPNLSDGGGGSRRRKPCTTMSVPSSCARWLHDKSDKAPIREVA
jgi:hypothetical protein